MELFDQIYLERYKMFPLPWNYYSFNIRLLISENMDYTDSDSGKSFWEWITSLKNKNCSITKFRTRQQN